MPNTLLLKRSSQAGKVPAPSNLQYGELSINYTDGVLYYKNNNNLVLPANATVANGTVSGVAFLNSANTLITSTNLKFDQASGNLILTSGTLSSNVNTGALVINGGVGVSGAIYASGSISTNELFVTQSTGDEGGQINLALAQTNTTLNTGIIIDVYQNKIRFFEGGGTARGAYIDLTQAAASAGTNLLAAGGGGTPGGSDKQIQFNNNGLFGGASNLLYYNATGNIVVSTTTTSTSVTTGALVVAGGLGLGGNLNAAGYGFFNGVFNESSTTGGVFVGNAGSGTPSPRIGFFNGTAEQNWQIDNYSGNFRWFTPGVTRMQLDAGGNLSIPATTSATSTSTGALTVSGGVGIGGNLYVSSSVGNSIVASGNIKASNMNVTGGYYVNGLPIPSGTVTSVSGTGSVSGISLTGTVTSSGSLTLGGTLDLSAPPAIGGTTPAAGTFTTLKATGNIVAGSTTVSTSATTGALVVTGGVGIGSNVYITGSAGNAIVTTAAIYSGSHYATTLNASLITTLSGNLVAASTTDSTNTTTGSIVSLGGVGIAKVLIAGGNIVAASSAISTSTTTGALVVAGGVGIGSNVYIANSAGNSIVATGNIQASNMNVTGSFYVNGSLFVSGGTVSSVSGTGSVSGITLSGTVTSSGSLTLGGTLDLSAPPAIGGTTPAAGTFTILKATGNIVAGSGTSSFDPTTGALVVSGTGGLGVGGRAFIAGNLVVANVTESTSTTVGSFVTQGGAGVAKVLMVGGNIVAASTTESTSTTIGSIVSLGGVGIAKVLMVGGNIVAASTTESTSTTVGSFVTQGGVGIAKVLIAGGNIVAASTTDSTNTTTGALVVTGGVGIAKVLIAGGNIVAGSTTVSTSTTTGALVVTGGVGIGSNIYVSSSAGNSIVASGNIQSANMNVTGGYYVNGAPILTAESDTLATVTARGASTTSAITLSNSTDSLSTTSGALKITGGLGVGGNVWIGGNLYVANVVSTTYSQLTINDPLLYLTANIPEPYIYDIGMYSQFVGGAYRTYGHTGFVRSQASNVWVLFSNVSAEPTNTINWNDSFIIYDAIRVGSANVSNTTPSTSTTTGALTVYGGLGVAGSLYNGGVTITTGNIVAAATTITGNTTSGALVSRGGLGVAGVAVIGGNIVAASGTASTTTTTGALVVAGGAGISGAVIAGGNIVASSTTSSTNTTTGALVVAGGTGIAGNINVAGTTNYFAGNVGIGISAPVYKLEVSGSSGQLFSVADSMTGTIFSVNDVSGIPSIEVLDTGLVKLAEFNGSVAIGKSSTTYKLEVNGSFAATTKSFIIDHPTKPGQKLCYGSLESPYHGVRLTGEAELAEKTCRIVLPEYIRELCKSEGAQVQITNIKHGKILWIEDLVIDENYFTVACDRSWLDSNTYRFYWSFTAIRKDIPDLIVEQ